MKNLIDSHQHVWQTSQRKYSWITPDVIEYFDHDFTQEQVNSEIKKLGVTGTIYVQAADSYEDTMAMFASAQKHPIVKGIVAWVPLHRPDEARAALDIFKKSPLLKGVRNLTHDYSNSIYNSDDAWILRSEVIETLKYVEELDLVLDYVAIKPSHTANISKVAELLPSLRIVIDHFAKPDIKRKQWGDWLDQMKDAATASNVFTKFSGLNVLSDWDSWTISDWRPYLNVMIEVFGSERIMTGGDWPFITMANNFETVWAAQLALLAELSEEDQENIRWKSAARAYKLAIN
jgi:L-fuconolactonase